MNKRFLAFFAMIFSLSFVFAQISVDPQDDFYMYAQGWELKGYVKSLPQLRPYPLNVIKQILSSVIEKGDKKNVEIAQNYWELVTGKPFHLVLEGGVREKIASDKARMSLNDTPFLLSKPTTFSSK